MENEHVKELMGILQKNKAPATKQFKAILTHVVAMEKQLETAVTELAAMRRDLADMEKRNHPLKNAMQKAVIVMQAQVLDLRDKLNALKQAVIDGCKNAVAAFKEKGISALDNIARFFKVKPILQAIHTGANKAAGLADKAVTNIEVASANYHEAGRRIKNAGRALAGKEAVQEAKPVGKVAKTFTSPFRAVRVCFAGIRNNAVAAVGILKRLEERAAEKKPSIYKDMEKHNKRIKEKEKERPTPTRGRSANAEL